MVRVYRFLPPWQGEPLSHRKIASVFNVSPSLSDHARFTDRNKNAICLVRPCPHFRHQIYIYFRSPSSHFSFTFRNSILPRLPCSTLGRTDYRDRNAQPRLVRIGFTPEISGFEAKAKAWIVKAEIPTLTSQSARR